jgi:hypothetical protein
MAEDDLIRGSADEQEELYQETQDAPTAEESVEVRQRRQDRLQLEATTAPIRSVTQPASPKKTGISKFSNTGKLIENPIPVFDVNLFAVEIPEDIRPVIIETENNTISSGPTGPTGAIGRRGSRGPQGRAGSQGPEGPCCTGSDLTVDETGLTLYGYTLGIDPNAFVVVTGISVGSITADILHVADQIKFANGMTAASVVTTVNGVSGDVTLTDLVGVATFNGAAGGITTSTLNLSFAGISVGANGITFSNGTNLASASLSALSDTNLSLVGNNSFLSYSTSTGKWFATSNLVKSFNGAVGDVQGVSTVNGATGNVTLTDLVGVATFNGATGGITSSNLHLDVAGISSSGGVTTDSVGSPSSSIDFDSSISFKNTGSLNFSVGGSSIASYQKHIFTNTIEGRKLAHFKEGISADAGFGVTFGGALQVDGDIHTDGGISADGGISGGHVHCATLTSDGAVNGTIFTASSYFSGTLIGNAQNALACSGVAASATTATNVAVTGVSDDVDYKVVITQHPGGGTSTLAAKTDSGSGADGLVYNPNTDLLSLGGISAGSGVTLNAGLHVTGGSTFGSAINFQDNQLERPKFKDYAETVNAIGTITGNTAIDFSAGNVQTVTGNGNCEFSFTNPPATGNAGTLTLLITNGGANTTTWASAVKWPSNVAPSLTASGIDILSFVTIDGGSNIYGFVGGLNFS